MGSTSNIVETNVDEPEPAAVYQNPAFQADKTPDGPEWRDLWYRHRDTCLCCHVRTGAFVVLLITALLSISTIVLILFERYYRDLFNKFNGVVEHYFLCLTFTPLFITSMMAMFANRTARKSWYFPHLLYSFFVQLVLLLGIMFFLFSTIHRRVSAPQSVEPVDFDLLWTTYLTVVFVVQWLLLDVVYRDYKYLNRKVG